MKKVDELLDDYDFQNENMNIKINEEFISKDEMNRIKNLTMIKANLQNKKSTKKRFIFPMAAAMTLILSFAVVFAQGGLSNIYYKLFGENIKYVNEMGTVIDKSYSANGITFNVANMLGDENSFYIVFELVKENGVSFKESEIEFETLRLDFKRSGGYTWYQVEDDDANDNKATFILEGNTESKTAGEKLNLLIKDITEYEINEPESKFNPYDFLSSNNDYLNQSLMENIYKTTEPIPDNITEEEKEKIEYLNNVDPSEILPLKHSNIKIIEENDNIYIDNVGFAEEKLCMRISHEDYGNNNIGDIYLQSKNDVEEKKYSDYSFSEEYEGVKYDYYIFDIKNMEELKNYDFKYNTVNKINTTKGEWSVSFKADYKNTTKTINVNKQVEIEGKKYTVKNIKLSPLSLNVKLKNNILDNMENRSHNLNDAVTVIMEDGSIVELSSWGASTNPLTSSINLMFKQPVDMTKIDVVKIADLDVEVQ